MGGRSTGRAPLPRRPSAWFPVTSLLAVREAAEDPQRRSSVSWLDDGGGEILCLGLLQYITIVAQLSPKASLYTVSLMLTSSMQLRLMVTKSWNILAWVEFYLKYGDNNTVSFCWAVVCKISSQQPNKKRKTTVYVVLVYCFWYGYQVTLVDEAGA